MDEINLNAPHASSAIAALPNETLRQWVRRILRQEFGRGALKSLGQNFLVQPSAIDAIVQPAAECDVQTVVEIGPGLGVLTKRLLEVFPSVIAIEKDRELGPWLVSKRFHQQAHLMLLQGDARAMDWEKQKHPWACVSNLPFNAGTFLLRKAIDSDTPPELCSVILQREVAERICNKGQGWSVLSVAVQLRMEARIAAHLPRTSYEPKPRVDTSVLVLKKRSTPLASFASPAERRQYMQVVKWAFSQRRKQLATPLAHGLSSHMHASVSPADVRACMQRVGLDPHARAETIAPEHWFALWRVIQSTYGSRLSW